MSVETTPSESRDSIFRITLRSPLERKTPSGLVWSNTRIALVIARRLRATADGSLFLRNEALVVRYDIEYAVMSRWLFAPIRSCCDATEISDLGHCAVAQSVFLLARFHCTHQHFEHGRVVSHKERHGVQRRVCESKERRRSELLLLWASYVYSKVGYRSS